jgi:hypothetical protein
VILKRQKEMLERIQEVINKAKSDIQTLQPDLAFEVDMSIYVDINHSLAIEAREKNWKPQRYNDSAWYEKSDEYGSMAVFVE